MADSNYCKQCGHKLEQTASVKISEEDYDRALPEEEQVSALLERAYRLRAEGDIGGAVALCEEILVLRPNSTSAHSLLGQLYEQSGRHAQAIQELETVLRLNPGSIADRVKLDELRNGGKPADRQSVPPRVMLLEGPHGGDSLLRLLVAGVVIVALALGGAYAVASHARPDATASAGHGSLSALPPSTVPQTSKAADSPVTSNNPATVASNSSGAPSYGFFPPYLYPAPSAPPAIVIRENSPSQRADAPASSKRQASGRPTKQAAATEDGNHVMLGGDGGSEDTGPYIIQISKPPASQTSHNPPPDKNVVIIQPPSGNNSASGDHPATAEARGAMAMALDLYQKHNYAQAINTYTKALPGAGDDKAVVYQQMARCYQKLGDKNSANTNYQSAINEYQRLVDAKRNVDSAQIGIRICQSGIKELSD
jgi:tetratricopeptide (TPR) repeat protein